MGDNERNLLLYMLWSINIDIWSRIPFPNLAPPLGPTPLFWMLMHRVGLGNIYFHVLCTNLENNPATNFLHFPAHQIAISAGLKFSMGRTTMKYMLCKLISGVPFPKQRFQPLSLVVLFWRATTQSSAGALGLSLNEAFLGYAPDPPQNQPR